jgi:hypothetical protein
VFATIAADLVLLGRLTELLDGAAGVVVGTLLVLLVPTSRELPRRVLLAGCLLLGWSQVLWWWPVAVGEPGRVTLGLAVLAGALAAWVGAASTRADRARRLRPRLRPADVALGLPVGIGIACTAPWLAAKTPTQTLGMLMGGWDNVAHFSMVHMIRRFGAVVSALPPPDPGATWQFASYPQGFHASPPGSVELLIGPDDTWLGRSSSRTRRRWRWWSSRSRRRWWRVLRAARRARRRAGAAGRGVRLGPCSSSGRARWPSAAASRTSPSPAGWPSPSCALSGPRPRVVSPLTLAAIGGAVRRHRGDRWVLLLAVAGPAVLVAASCRCGGTVGGGPGARRGVGGASSWRCWRGCWRRPPSCSRGCEAASPLTVDGGRVHVDFGLVVAAALAIVGIGVALGAQAPRVAASHGGAAWPRRLAAWLIAAPGRGQRGDHLLRPEIPAGRGDRAVRRACRCRGVPARTP